MIVDRFNLIELVKKADWDFISDTELEELALTLGLRDPEGFDFVLSDEENSGPSGSIQMTYTYQTDEHKIPDGKANLDLSCNVLAKLGYDRFHVAEIKLKGKMSICEILPPST